MKTKMRKLLLAVSALCMTISAFTQDLSDEFAKSKNSVVTIYVAEAVNPGIGNPVQLTSNMGLGSGVLIADNIVLTASHVVDAAERIMVQFYDGEAIPARLRRLNRTADVALIELDKAPENGRIATLADSDNVRIGQSIYVIGAPMGLPYSLSRGIISGKRAEEQTSSDGKKMEFFQTDASINTGNSGGPMFNMKGEVVGIVSSILTRSGGFEGIGFAATSNIAKSLLDDRASRFFGTESMLLPPELAKILNVPQRSGMLVLHVVQNSPANTVGLRGGYLNVQIMEQEIMLGGDIMLAVDDIVIDSQEGYEKLYDYLNSVESVKTHRIKVLREGEIVELRWVSKNFDPGFE